MPLFSAPLPHESSPIDTLTQIESNIQSNEIERENSISNSARLISAASGALITSIVVTPFDVIKTRLQAQFNIKSSISTNNTPHSISSRLPRNVVSTWCDTCLMFAPYQHSMHHLTPIGAGHCVIELGHINTPHTHLRSSTPLNNISDLCPSDRVTLKSTEPHFNGSIDAVKQLVRNEGVISLWRGLTATLAMSVPSTVIYYSMYDKLKISYHQYLSRHDTTLLTLNTAQYSNNHQHCMQLSDLSPLLAGTSARTLTTVVVSPVELIRTRTQATSAKSVTALSIVQQELQRGGIRALWRGVYPTLWRDVPFSAVYWTIYESMKYRLFTHWSLNNIDTSISHQQLHRQTIVTAAFISGATSGIIAASLTHPFDLVKTRRQIDMYQSYTAPNNTNSSISSQTHKSMTSTYSIIKTIIHNEGISALWSGIVPRVLKIAPACSIMIGSYEATKTYLSKQDIQ